MTFSALRRCFACNVLCEFWASSFADRQTGPAAWRGEPGQEKIRWLHGRLDRPPSLTVRRSAGALRFRESGSAWLICQQTSPVRVQLRCLWIGGDVAIRQGGD
jgi:hypothetical protein